MDRRIILLLIVLGGLSFLGAGCIGGGGCSKDKDCKDWQKCDLEKKSCALKQGYCEKEEECGDPLLTCNNKTHTCDFKANKCKGDANCEKWQVCSIADNSCVPKAGFCTSRQPKT